MPDPSVSSNELLEAWPLLSDEDRKQGFSMLSRIEAEGLFHALPAFDQTQLLLSLEVPETRLWLRVMAPDDAADVIQQCDEEQREVLLSLMDDMTRKEVLALLAYSEDDAGGLMNPRFARLRPDMSADEAISYLRRQTRERVENIYYAYVLDSHQKLLGVVSLRELVTATPDKKVRDLMRTEIVTATAETDQETLSNLFATHDLTMIPVVNEDGIIQGVVTVDDIVDVVREEATEDIQKIGGVAALDAPYLHTSFKQMIIKRAPWLIILFLGQMVTINVVEHFQSKLATAAALIAFIPLIVSSGGKSGSQAGTLVVRALALGEIGLREWFRIAMREVIVGLALGMLLATLGMLRIILWHNMNWADYSQWYLLVGAAVAGSLVAVVLWGTLVGSMLPLVLRRIGVDPATASTPFVATLCDVTGLIIYFTVSTAILRGTLLPA